MCGNIATISTQIGMYGAETDILGLKYVVNVALFCSNDYNMVISENTLLNIGDSGHVHNHYKLDITKFMSILLLDVVLRYCSL